MDAENERLRNELQLVVNEVLGTECIVQYDGLRDVFLVLRDGEELRAFMPGSIAQEHRHDLIHALRAFAKK